MTPPRAADLALYVALAVGIGVAVRPSVPGALAVAALAAVAAVFRRQDSVDYTTDGVVHDLDRLENAEAAIEAAKKEAREVSAAHHALRDEFDKVKIRIPRGPG